ncbi:ubiquitin carboxyl-terminal hydrolase 37-like [Anguilla rostrata]|uniref:ubiquitin carboxyl-terminal hydrolase 37-like n=1 Tax=Anguilla rostrata TaxID=7938 RepID=UPI0030CD16CD
MTTSYIRELSLTTDSTEQSALSDGKEQPTLSICAEQTHNCAELTGTSSNLMLSHPPSILPSAPAAARESAGSALSRAEVKGTGWFGGIRNSLRRKFAEERISEDETQSERLVHTFLGLPNLRNTCYLNATLQSLFNLKGFMEDVKREQSSHLLKCVAELHAARRCSSSSNKKVDLLKTLKNSVSQYCMDFCGHEQQDAHEFLSVLMSQMKEEGFLLNMANGLPYTCPVEANFEFDLLSRRTCLSCGETVRKVESYNSLSVDLVPGGSVQDSLALYFKVSVRLDHHH